MGVTNSGKTTALKYLDRMIFSLFPTVRHYILDTKIEGDDFAFYEGVHIGSHAPKPPKKRYQVWRCPKVIPEQLEKWLWGIRKDAPAFLCVDELHSLCYGRNAYSDEYNLIQKWGRAAPIGVVTGTQELVRIPPNAFKQSTHRLRFYMEGRYDRSIANDMIKRKVEEPVDPFGVYYQHINRREEPLYFKDIQTLLRGE